VTDVYRYHDVSQYLGPSRMGAAVRQGCAGGRTRSQTRAFRAVQNKPISVEPELATLARRRRSPCRQPQPLALARGHSARGTSLVSQFHLPKTVLLAAVQSSISVFLYIYFPESGVPRGGIESSLEMSRSILCFAFP
jgi:hypothetical protein